LLRKEDGSPQSKVKTIAIFYGKIHLNQHCRQYVAVTWRAADGPSVSGKPLSRVKLVSRPDHLLSSTRLLRYDFYLIRWEYVLQESEGCCQIICELSTV